MAPSRPNLFSSQLNQTGLMAITQMAAGDGFADIVGRRWGKVLLAHLDSSRPNSAQLVSPPLLSSHLISSPLLSFCRISSLLALPDWFTPHLLVRLDPLDLQTKWPWSQRKSVVGTTAFVLGAFAVTLAEVAWFNQVWARVCVCGRGAGVCFCVCARGEWGVHVFVAGRGWGCGCFMDFL